LSSDYSSIGGTVDYEMEGGSFARVR